MKTSFNVRALAQDHARGIIRGTRTPLDIVATVEAMKGEEGHVAAALYALEVASLVPDSVESEIRRVIGAALDLPDTEPKPKRLQGEGRRRLTAEERKNPTAPDDFDIVTGPIDHWDLFWNVAAKEWQDFPASRVGTRSTAREIVIRAKPNK